MDFRNCRRRSRAGDRRFPSAHASLFACARRLGWCAALAAGIVLGPTRSAAADTRDDLIQTLLTRLGALEQRVQKQEEELATLRRPAPPARPAAAATPPVAGSGAPAPPIANVGETADAWAESHAPMLTLRGFGDVQYRYRNSAADTNAFTVGQIDLFVTSRITSELHLLNENVIKVDSQGNSNVEAERLLIRYSPSDYLNISAGRYHTALGFYNTAYHHGAWFQTAVGRPLPFRGEDGGGILPIHNVGLSINGQVPWTNAGLHYTVEVGNGRDYRLGANVQQSGDVNDQKAFNVALVFRPDGVPGLQTGVSFYTDRPTIASGAAVRQNILALHAVYQRPTIEWLNEFIVMRNDPARGGPARETRSFYTQLGRSFGAFRPYVRYHLLDVAAGDLVLPNPAGKSHGPSFGLRYNLSNFTALKLQYDRLWIERSPTLNDFTLQWAFTF